MHVGTVHTPPAHTPLMQSAPTAHIIPSPQRAHSAPPQSTLVSMPFWIPSAHDGTPQTALEQTPLAQSVAITQRIASLQRGQALPPQSTSVSSPSRTASLQVVRQTPPEQVPD
jgi:hypothetical protein